MFARIKGYVRRISGTQSIHSVTDLRTGRAQALSYGGTLAARSSDVRIGRGIVRAMEGARRAGRSARRLESAHANSLGVLLIDADKCATIRPDGERFIWRGE